MSVKVMGKVWDTDLPPNLRLVLLAYADAAEHDGTEIWPGRERIATMTGYSVPTIDRLTRDLLEAGLLIQVQRGHKGQRAAYLIPLAELEAYQLDSHPEPNSISTGDESLSPGAVVSIVGDSPPVLDPSSPSVLVAATPRRNDDYMDALVALFGEPEHWSHYQSVISHIKEHGGRPEDIPARTALLVAEWGKSKATPASLKKWWTRYDAAVANVTDSDVEEYERQQRHAATRERLANE